MSLWIVSCLGWYCFTTTPPSFLTWCQIYPSWRRPMPSSPNRSEWWPWSASLGDSAARMHAMLAPMNTSCPRMHLHRSGSQHWITALMVGLRQIVSWQLLHSKYLAQLLKLSVCQVFCLCELSGTSGLKYQDGSCQLFNPPPHIHMHTRIHRWDINPSQQPLTAVCGDTQLSQLHITEVCFTAVTKPVCSSSQLSAQHGSLKQPRSSAVFFT